MTAVCVSCILAVEEGLGLPYGLSCAVGALAAIGILLFYLTALLRRKGR